MTRSSSDKGGCGCLILIVLIIVFVVNKCNEPKSSSNADSGKTSTAYQRPSHVADASSQFDEEPEGELSEEDKIYLSNSLATGTTPYVQSYGKNYHCPYSQCSGIKITAPGESDIVVIIKKNNSEGRVVAHGYIKAGGTCQFDIPDGTYQTFFYYGEGWNPNKDMGNGVKGGFVKNELFSKDNPQNIYSAVLTYILQLQRDGNFQTKSSNKGEVF